ncbi:MAG: MFS transporter [Catenulispora sp.]|nr:MFS transporter [Catenulispora sp.]
MSDRAGFLSSLIAPLRGRREFRLMWAGQTLSVLGSQLTMLALPLVVLRATGSATAAGLALTVRLLAATAARLPAGVSADRSDRRRLMMTADASRAAAVLGVAVAVLCHHTWLPVILAAVVVDGVATAYFGPAQSAAVRHLVADDDLASVMGLNQARAQSISVIGPPLGGLLFAVAPWLPFVIDVATYTVSLACLAAIRTPLGGRRTEADGAGEDGSGEDGSGESIMQGALAGLRFVGRQRFLTWLLAWAALTNFATAGVVFGLLLVVGPSHASAIGTAYALVACGGIAGAMVAPRLVRVRPVAVVLGASIVTAGMGLAIAVSPTPATAIAAIAGICAVGPLIAVPLETRVYSVVPDEWMGRVQSSLFLVGGSIYPLGGLVMGALAQHTSVRWAYAAFAVVLAVVLVLTATPTFRRQIAAFGAATGSTSDSTSASTSDSVTAIRSEETREPQPAGAASAH